jgi:hypothetical protein
MRSTHFTRALKGVGSVASLRLHQPASRSTRFSSSSLS